MIGIRVIKTAEISERDWAAVVHLFQQGYEQANLNYLAKAKTLFRYVAMGEHAGQAVGFVFADSLLREMPGLKGLQSIALTGIGCIDAEVRNQGLFSHLAMKAMQAGDMQPDAPVLFAGRMAHVITYRTMAKISPTVIPKPEVKVSEWQHQVASAVAALLGSRLEAESLVVRGNGTPVGYPKVQYQTTGHEEQLFSEVNRDKGDSLLTLCWVPEAPAGWQ